MGRHDLDAALRQKIARLFEYPRSLLAMKYRDERAELRAIAAGRKQMSVFGGPLDGPFVDDIVALAATLGLCVVVRPDGPMPGVYVVRAEQAWRVAAFEQLFAGSYGWPDFAEAATSRLLGYSETDIRRWVAQCNQRGAYRTHAYLLLSPALRRALAGVDYRAFPRGSLAEGAIAFRISRTCVPRKRARDLARFELDAASWRTLLLGKAGEWIAARRIDERDRAALNRALTSKIEAWNGRRWR